MNFWSEEIADFWKQRKSDHVFVDDQQLQDLVKKMKDPLLTSISIPNWRMPNMLPDNDRTFLNHIFYQSAVNFAFTHFSEPYEKFEVEDETGKFSGAMAMSRCFYREFGEEPITVERMLEISQSYGNMVKFFQGKNLPPLLDWRQQNLREVAEVLKEKFNGQPAYILKRADWCVDRAINILMNEFPCSFGLDHYARHDFAFNKRINLWLLLYQGRACDSLGRIRALSDPEDIGPVADYQVAKALRSMDVFKYSEKLDQKIANHELIPCGGEMELEIRAATVFVVCELMELTSLSIMEVDNFLWREGRKNKNFNHHLTMTTAY